MDSQGSVSLFQEKYDKALIEDKDHSITTREQQSAQKERSLLFHPASLLPEQHLLSIVLLRPRDNHIPHTIKAVLSSLIPKQASFSFQRQLRSRRMKGSSRRAGAKWGLSRVQLSISSLRDGQDPVPNKLHLLPLKFLYVVTILNRLSNCRLQCLHEPGLSGFLRLPQAISCQARQASELPLMYLLDSELPSLPD